MTPVWKQRLAQETTRPKWKVADLRTSLPKCPNAVPRNALPSYTFGSKALKYHTAYRPSESSVIGSYGWGEPVVHRASGYHGRHAEESPVRPRIVTVVRPCGELSPRKISLLLNRRAVQTFELLMADVSEALGYPCWNSGRVRRLFSATGREIRSLSEFFHFDHAFLAFGNSRPTLSEVQAALNEVYPDNPGYCDSLLKLWERILRPKAAKADSGFHDDDPQADNSENVALDPPVSQPVANNLQPIRAQVRQKDKEGKQKGEREPWRRHVQPQTKAQNKEESGTERKKEPVYCWSCRGLGPPVPPIRTKQCAKWEGPNNQKKAPPSQAIRLENKSQQHQNREVQSDDVNNDSKTKVQNKVLFPVTQTEIPSGQSMLVSGWAERSDWQQGLPPDGTEVLPEEILHCYDLGGVVGDGNFAVVRECRVRGCSQTFAMKIVDKAKLQGRGHMIQNEIALMRSLAHPRLVKLLRSHHTHTHVYLLMELVAGGDLFDAIARSGQFTEPSAACMVQDISQALEYIHDKSIAHRDLKPENLLVQRHSSGSMSLKLADFGLAMVVTEPVFTVCGTPTYVAPEILAETGYGVAVDVWAMGVILFVLLSGFPPFRSPDRNQEELFRLIQKGEVHFISPYWDHVSNGAKVLIRALLEVDPNVRLTARQTLQNSWLQHATAQIDHKGEINANAIDKKDQLKASHRTDECNQLKSNYSKSLSLVVKADQINNNSEDNTDTYTPEHNRDASSNQKNQQ
ncbi:serine/threonine-protein kinase DCLK3 [Brachyhypopomus gauderio]|uniref:serine/threonine-protein kinase DCLK3 n=1 Tax=Brachyhypopomus gauderio TaxID=698409 RepID=UPI0040437357